MYIPRVVRCGEKKGVAGVCEAEDESLVGGGGAGSEDEVVGIKAHFVASNVRHHPCQSLHATIWFLLVQYSIYVYKL